MSDEMALTVDERNSSAAQKIVERLRARVELARTQLEHDKDEIETAHLRGRIRALRQIEREILGKPAAEVRDS